MVNGTIVESHAANATTFAVKTLAGNDPSTTDIVYLAVRSATPGAGSYSVVSISAALSFTISSGSTLGASSGVPFKLWLVAFNDAGTARIAAINTVSGGNIYPLGQFPIASASAEGGAGGADSAQVFYAGASVSSKAYVPIGYASYESGLVTAGAWDASPTRIQLYNPYVPLPSTVIQINRTDTSSVSVGTTALPVDNSIPQNTEGNEFQSQAITPTSATNFVEVDSNTALSNGGSSLVAAALFQDSTVSAIAADMGVASTASGSASIRISKRQLSSTTSATTFKIRGGSNSGNTTFNGAASAQLFGGVMNSFISVSEIMT